MAALLGVQPLSTGRMVDRLVAGVLIERNPHPTSRRELIARLTSRGRKVVAQVTVQRRNEIARMVETMPATERRGLVCALTAFAKAGGDLPARIDIDAS